MKGLRKGVAGFTLIEVMITVVIFAIGAALAAPSFADFIEKRHLTRGAEGLADFLMLARGEAVKRNQETTISFEKSDGTDWCLGITLGPAPCECGSEPDDEKYCALEYIDSDGNRVVEPQLIVSSDHPQFDLTAESNTGTGALTFDPVRGVRSNPTESAALFIQTKRSGYELKVNVTATGIVKICSSSSNKIIGYKACS